MSKIIEICVTLILLKMSCLEHALAQKEPVATLPVPPSCGMPFYDRLLGRPQTEIDEFQWTALIQYRKDNGQTGFHCGGSLINSRYVLTTAHCVQAKPSGWKAFGVRLGEWDLSKDQDCEKANRYCSDAPVDVGIEKIIVHEDYTNNKSRYNTIALIRFNRPVDMSGYVFPICLPIKEPQRSQNIVGLKGYAAGWAKTVEGARSNEKLKIRLNFTDSETCTNKYSRFEVILKDTQLCAKRLDSQDPCSSAGSPLTKQEHFKDFNYVNYQYGISSIGPKTCGSKDIPEVYTNVAKFIDWIESKME